MQVAPAVSQPRFLDLGLPEEPGPGRQPPGAQLGRGEAGLALFVAEF